MNFTVAGIPYRYSYQVYQRPGGQYQITGIARLKEVVFDPWQRRIQLVNAVKAGRMPITPTLRPKRAGE